MRLVDERFRTLILAREMRSEAAAAELEFDNTLLERFSFSVVSGVLTGTFTSAQPYRLEVAGGFFFGANFDSE